MLGIILRNRRPNTTGDLIIDIYVNSIDWTGQAMTTNGIVFNDAASFSRIIFAHYRPIHCLQRPF